MGLSLNECIQAFVNLLLIASEMFNCVHVFLINNAEEHKPMHPYRFSGFCTCPMKALIHDTSVSQVPSTILGLADDQTCDSKFTVQSFTT